MPLFRSWPATLFSAWVVVTPILSGCVTVPQDSSASQSKPVATGQTQSAAPALATSAPALPAAEYTIYQGHYTCGQGRTALTLKINMTGNVADAVFDFKTQRDIRGAFAMQGTFDGKTRKIRLQGRNWINQPRNFSTVNLFGRFNADRSRLSGQVIGGGCSTFEVRKTGAETVTMVANQPAPARQQPEPQNQSLAIDGNQVIRAAGFRAEPPNCSIELLGEYFQSNEIPKWHGLCWDGKAQGPGKLVYPAKGDFFKYEYDATGLVINGKFRTGPKLTNARTREDDGGRVLDLKKLGPEEFEFFDKFEKSEWMQFEGGCRLIGGGLFDRREWNGLVGKVDLREKFGANWVDSRGVSSNYSYGTIPRAVKLLTPCEGGLLQGKVTVGGTRIRFIIDNVVDGVPAGKITLEGNYKVPVFIWYYKGIWFDKYKDYQATVDAFERYFKKKSTQATNKRLNVIKKGFSIESDSEELKYEVEKSLAEAFDVKLALSASAQEPSRWNDSFMGMTGEGVKAVTDFYLHYKISPKKNFVMPRDVSGIHLKLDTSIIMRKNIAMGWFGTQEEEHFSSIVSMTLDRSKGFAESGKLKVFDVRTFTSWGADKGLKISHDNARPRISIKSIEVK